MSHNAFTQSVTDQLSELVATGRLTGWTLDSITKQSLQRLYSSPDTSLTAFKQSARMISFKGHAGVVSSTVNEIFRSITSTSFIIPNETRSFLKSGSMTVLKAFSTSSFFTTLSVNFNEM